MTRPRHRERARGATLGLLHMLRRPTLIWTLIHLHVQIPHGYFILYIAGLTTWHRFRIREPSELWLKSKQ